MIKECLSKPVEKNIYNFCMKTFCELLLFLLMYPAMLQYFMRNLIAFLHSPVVSNAIYIKNFLFHLQRISAVASTRAPDIKAAAMYRSRNSSSYTYLPIHLAFLHFILFFFYFKLTDSHLKCLAVYRIKHEETATRFGEERR